MPRDSLGVHIKADDIAYAERQHRFRCAIVRAIQREVPEATRVMADAKTIRFTIQDDADPVRWVFETPPEVVEKVIKPFDLGEEMSETSFVLDHAIDRYTPQKKTAKEKADMRRKWRSDYRPRRRNPSATPSSVKNRFIVPVPVDEEQEAAE